VGVYPTPSWGRASGSLGWCVGSGPCCSLFLRFWCTYPSCWVVWLCVAAVSPVAVFLTWWCCGWSGSVCGVGVWLASHWRLDERNMRGCGAGMAVCDTLGGSSAGGAGGVDWIGVCGSILGRLSLAWCTVLVGPASGALLDAERSVRGFVAGLSGLLGRARGGAGKMASYCMVGIAVAGGTGGLAGGSLCCVAGLAWLSARMPGSLGVASCCCIAGAARAGCDGGVFGI
jgi:hypothetical protein